MVDRLDRLRHDAVVGRHHEDDDIGDVRAASAHRGERFMTGCVDEGDPTSVLLRDGRTDVLRDATSFGGGDTGLADGVEQGGLPVVHVPHDGDDGRTRTEVAWVIDEREAWLLLGRHDLHLDPEVLGEDLHGIGAHRLVHRMRIAQHQQTLDDFACRHLKRLGELCDRRVDGYADRRRLDP